MSDTDTPRTPHSSETAAALVAEMQDRILAMQQERDRALEKLQMMVSPAKAQETLLALAKMQRDKQQAEAERDRLKAANARHVIAHIERICPACGHNQDEDKQCANCLKSSYDLLRDEFKRIEAVLHGNVMPYATEISGICQRAVSGIERTVPITVELEKTQQERDRLAEMLAVCEEALTEFFALMEDKIIARNTDNDCNGMMFVSESLRLTRTLAKADAALTRIRAMKGQP